MTVAHGEWSRVRTLLHNEYRAELRLRALQWLYVTLRFAELHEKGVPQTQLNQFSRGQKHLRAFLIHRQQLGAGEIHNVGA